MWGAAASGGQSRCCPAVIARFPFLANPNVYPGFPATQPDVFNRNSNKQVAGFSRPFILVISFDSTTPRRSDSLARIKQWLARTAGPRTFQ